MKKKMLTVERFGVIAKVACKDSSSPRKQTPLQ